MSVEGVHDMHITEGTVNSDKFADFICNCLLPWTMGADNCNGINVRFGDHGQCQHPSYRRSERFN